VGVALRQGRTGMTATGLPRRSASAKPGGPAGSCSPPLLGSGVGPFLRRDRRPTWRFRGSATTSDAGLGDLQWDAQRVHASRWPAFILLGGSLAEPVSAGAGCSSSARSWFPRWPQPCAGLGPEHRTCWFAAPGGCRGNRGGALLDAGAAWRSSRPLVRGPKDRFPGRSGGPGSGLGGIRPGAGPGRSSAGLADRGPGPWRLVCPGPTCRFAALVRLGGGPRARCRRSVDPTSSRRLGRTGHGAGCPSGLAGLGPTPRSPAGNGGGRSRGWIRGRHDRCAGP